jgi:hypothetical protein
MTLSSFAVTWDYRCPFARNAHDHIVTALQGGTDWDVRFVPFSLNQVHVAEGDPPVWDDPAQRSTITAMLAGVAIRDRWPERFLDVHQALFVARHDDGRDIREEGVVRAVLGEQGLDADEVFAEIEAGGPIEAFRKEHEAAVAELAVFGVPTFIGPAGDGSDQAVFVRLMHRPAGDVDVARTTIERVMDLVTGWTDLNEFKHTKIPR